MKRNDARVFTSSDGVVLHGSQHKVRKWIIFFKAPTIVVTIVQDVILLRQHAPA